MNEIIEMITGGMELLPEYLLLVRLVVFILSVEAAVSLTAILCPLAKIGGGK